jgi:hypothetical protein
VNTADVPLKITLVMPVRLVPRIEISCTSGNPAVLVPEKSHYFGVERDSVRFAADFF